MISIVVAYDQKRGIGADNDLLWQRDLPADLAHFKKLTTNKSIVMGRKTFESIGSKPLPNRQNIVLSRHATGVAGVLTALSLEAAYSLAQYPVVVIGGQSVFAAALDKVDTIYATEVKAEFPEATVFFPELDDSVWYEVDRQPNYRDERNKYDFDFVTYKRR